MVGGWPGSLHQCLLSEGAHSWGQSPLPPDSSSPSSPPLSVSSCAVPQPSAEIPPLRSVLVADLPAGGQSGAGCLEVSFLAGLSSLSLHLLLLHLLLPPPLVLLPLLLLLLLLPLLLLLLPSVYSPVYEIVLCL